MMFPGKTRKIMKPQISFPEMVKERKKEKKMGGMGILNDELIT